MSDSANKRGTTSISLSSRLVISALLVCIPLNSYAAEQQTAFVTVEAGFEPVSSVGLLISPDNPAQQILGNQVEQTYAGVFTVSFPYDPEQTVYGTLATAMLLSAEGEFAFGNLTMLPPAGQQISNEPVPACPPPEGDARFHNSMSILSRLIKNRTERRNNRMEYLERVLDQDLLDKLVKLEKMFGLDGSGQLSTDMNPVELVDRLTRIHSALKTWAIHKQKRKEAARQE